jgi:NAD(P)-dependent dehydrogenase (short-subunit alcohol dehydrogenase family)
LTSKSQALLNLRGKLSLVTGGTQGIGFAIAQTLAEEGCKLIICGRNESRLRRTQKQLSATGADVETISCDVRDQSSVARLFSAMKKKTGRLDILINSAGIAHPFTPVKKLSVKTWNDVLDTNLTGTFLVTQAALPLLKRGSQIVNVLSMSSRRTFPELAAYNASKFGALGFTNTLRDEVRKEGIRVIAVLPGSTDTPIWNTLWPEAPREKMIAPETVAQAVMHALKSPAESVIEEISIMPAGGAL